MRTIDFRQDLLPLKDRIFRTALRITLSREEAEDITQDVLVKAWQKREELADVRNLEVYVLQMARNLALDHVERAAAHDVPLDSINVEPPDRSPRADEVLEANETLEKLRRHIAQLPPDQRKALLLRETEEKPYADIAAAMGVTEANAKVLVHRARTTIKKMMEGDIKLEGDKPTRKQQ